MNKNKLLISCSIIIVLLAGISYASANDNIMFSRPKVHLKNGASSNWAGYSVLTNLNSPQNGAVTDVKGSWIVPSVNCIITPNSYSSFWIGIDGYSSNSVEQTGTDSDCSSGTPVYYAWYEMYPKYPVNLRMKVSPGDTMTAEVKYTGSGRFQITISDTTKGTTYTTTQKSNFAKRSSAEWIAEAPSSSQGVLPLADFSSVSFKNSQATLNGHTGTISDTAWQNDNIVMETSSLAPKALPSALSPDGSVFTVAWKHS